MIILPVIHFSTKDAAFKNAEIVFGNGCDGVFLINMDNPDAESILPSVCRELKENYPEKKIGINFLFTEFMVGLVNHYECFDMIWTDNLIPERYDQPIELLTNKKSMEIYESFAFKYQKKDVDFIATGETILSKNRIPTTSGSATGVAASLEKMQNLEHFPKLALASGLTPENIHSYKNYITHALVATGISSSFYDFDPIKVKDFVQAARD